MDVYDKWKCVTDPTQGHFELLNVMSKKKNTNLQLYKNFNLQWKCIMCIFMWTNTTCRVDCFSTAVLPFNHRLPHNNTRPRVQTNPCPSLMCLCSYLGDEDAVKFKELPVVMATGQQLPNFGSERLRNTAADQRGQSLWTGGQVPMPDANRHIFISNYSFHILKMTV